jgi:ubiquinone/menaquinone biosynthesis C-methylase UbiE
MDAPGLPPEVLAQNLADLRRVNRWLGGTQLTLNALDRLGRGRARSAELCVLDLACGAADIGLAVAQRAAQHGRRVRVIATDLNSRMLRLAADRAGGELAFAVADARCLPFASRAVDVVMCSLALHHFAPPEAVEVLREMGRVARLGVIVNDLVRCWWGLAGAWLFGRCCSQGALTRHDAPVSALRAYTRAELRALAEQAALRRIHFAGYLGYRVAMTASSGA